MGIALEQMQDNLSYMKDFKGLTAAEKATLKQAQEALAKIPLIPCTTCNYCAKVCPMNIGVSGSFTAMNYYTLYKDLAAATSAAAVRPVPESARWAQSPARCVIRIRSIRQSALSAAPAKKPARSILKSAKNW